MKTRLKVTVDQMLCLGAVWTHFSSLLILTIVSTIFHQHQVGTATSRSLRSIPILTSSPHSISSKLGTSSNEVNESLTKPDALARLSKVFGISRIPRWEFHRSPPQYMQDLYASLTDTGGLTRASGPYNSNVIRSFPDRERSQRQCTNIVALDDGPRCNLKKMKIFYSIHRMHFLYNISYLEEKEQVLQAEFHLFKMKPAPSTSHQTALPHVILIKIFEVLDIREMASHHGLLLLDARRISVHSNGWHVFNVTRAVLRWHLGIANNFGFLVTAETASGIHVNGSYIRFAQRNEHHDSKQPILVVFTNDGQRKHPNYISPDDEEYLEIKEDILRRQLQKQHRDTDNFRGAIRMLNERGRMTHRTSLVSRSKRSAKNRNGDRKKRTYETHRYRQNNRSCTRYEMFVDFEEIGWSGWIISPNSYNAYHCAGECPFPLGQGQKPTNHATVQSIVHALGVGKNINTPCCVPNKLYSISLLYFDDNENVILKQYDDMVVASCGCH